MDSDWKALDSKRVWHPFTPTPHLGPRALITRALGSYLYDSDGKPYFDATSSWWCQIHGHCNPRLVAALAEQAGQLDQMLFAPHAHPVAIELSEALVKKLGAPFSRVFYSDDGSTAVEAALKMALQYWAIKKQTQRTRFLSLERAYHGDTLGAVSVGQVGEYHAVFQGDLPSALHATVPYCYRCPLNKTFPQCGVACVESAEKTLEQRGDEIAAVIVEPLVLGAGGMISYPPEYLSRLVKAARAAGALIIFDEVFTGFGRTGTFFAMEQIAERPDIVCLSKGLTSGMLALGATVVTDSVYEPFQESPAHVFQHGHTFTANALSTRIALESLKLFDEEKVIDRNQALITVFREAALTFRDHPRVGNVRHLGMIFAVEIVREKGAKTLFDPPNGPLWRVAEALWAKGVWFRPLGGVLYLVPPYSTTPLELKNVLGLLYSELGNEAHFADGK